MSLSRSLVPALLAPLTVLAGVALPAGAAHADTRTVRDAAHDVVTGPADEDNPSTPDPGHTREDVLSMRVQHGARVVRVTTTYAALTPASARGADIVHVLSLRTNEGVRAGIYLIVPGDGSRPGGTSTWDAERRAPLRCRGAVARLDRASSSVTFTVPRRCLSNPRWVRVGAGAGALSQDQLSADDAQATGRVGHELVLGPRVRR